MTDLVPLAELTAALDEIHRLRRALAYEAWGIGTHLTYKGFPTSRRPFAEEQVARMRDAACGDSSRAYADVSIRTLRSVTSMAGAGQTLTRAEFAQEQGLQAPAPAGSAAANSDVDELLRRVHDQLGGLGVDLHTFGGTGETTAAWRRSYDGVISDERSTIASTLTGALLAVLDWERDADLADAAEAADEYAETSAAESATSAADEYAAAQAEEETADRR